jgi:hypothetical protein
MAGRPKGVESKPRSDIGAKRGKYKVRLEKRGKTGRENNPIKSFWTHHTMDQVIVMSEKELEEAISIWIEKYQETQIKRNPFWWYPDIAIKTLNEVRNTRTNIDKGWNL